MSRPTNRELHDINGSWQTGAIHWLVRQEIERREAKRGGPPKTVNVEGLWELIDRTTDLSGEKARLGALPFSSANIDARLDDIDEESDATIAALEARIGPRPKR